MVNVAFTGRKYSGKSTAQEVLLKRGWEFISFIQPVKEMMRALLRYNGVSHSEIERMIEGDLKEIPSSVLGGKTPRYAMQTLGLEWGRGMMCPNIWINMLEARISYLDPQGFLKWTVADCRMPNEVEWLRAKGWKVFKIVRLGLDESDKHGTEAYIDGLLADEQITNDADSAEEFKGIVRNTLEMNGIIRA